MKAAPVYISAITVVLSLSAAPTTALDVKDEGGGHDDHCNCLNWQDTYRYRGVSCGQGNELFVGTHGSTNPVRLAKVKAAIGLEFCTLFYERVDDFYCMNIGMHNAIGQWQNGEWCYVSEKCQALNGGRHVRNSEVSWKVCDQAGGRDKLLRSNSPEELQDMAEENDWELGLLVKMAYPMWESKEGSTLDDIVAAFNVMNMSSDVTRMNITNEDERTKHDLWVQELMARRTVLQMKIMEVVSSGQPMIFLDDASGQPPFFVIHGMKAFAVTMNPGKDMAHPGTWNVLVCTSGCTAMSLPPAALLLGQPGHANSIVAPALPKGSEDSD